MWWVPSFRDPYTTFCQISTKNNAIRTYIPLISSFVKYAVVVCGCICVCIYCGAVMGTFLIE